MSESHDAEFKPEVNLTRAQQKLWTARAILFPALKLTPRYQYFLRDHELRNQNLNSFYARKRSKSRPFKVTEKPIAPKTPRLDHSKETMENIVRFIVSSYDPSGIRGEHVVARDLKSLALMSSSMLPFARYGIQLFASILPCIPRLLTNVEVDWDRFLSEPESFSRDVLVQLADALSIPLIKDNRKSELTEQGIFCF